MSYPMRCSAAIAYAALTAVIATNGLPGCFIAITLPLSPRLRASRPPHRDLHANGSTMEQCGPDVDCDPSPKNVKLLLGAADEMLKQKNMESVMFVGKRIGEHTNMEKLDWFAGKLVMEHQRRSCRIAPTVAFKQPPPKQAMYRWHCASLRQEVPDRQTSDVDMTLRTEIGSRSINKVPDRQTLDADMTPRTEIGSRSINKQVSASSPTRYKVKLCDREGA